MYSTSISQLMNSVENNSLHASDSIGCRSIAHSAGSSASSCKSISDPQVLLTKAVLDLKRSAREEESEEFIEYWDTWNYWNRHPFVINNQILSGKLLLEHLVILTNLKCKDTFKVFSDIKIWLQSVQSQSNAISISITNENENEIFIQLRDQLCAGFFLIFCQDLKESFEYLNEVENVLVSEYFEALKVELESKQQQQQRKSTEALALTNINNNNNNNNTPFLSYSATVKILNQISIENLKKFLLFFNEFAQGILEKLKVKHSLLVQIIRSNSRNLFLFCNRLVRILMQKLRIQ